MIYRMCQSAGYSSFIIGRRYTLTAASTKVRCTQATLYHVSGGTSAIFLILQSGQYKVPWKLSSLRPTWFRERQCQTRHLLTQVVSKLTVRRASATD